MLNNFCFHVYAQKWVFVIMSHVACHMSHVKCLSWSLGHAEQFLFSCLCSNIAVYGCKRQCFFFDTTTLSCDSWVHRAGSQLKKLKSQSERQTDRKIYRVQGRQEWQNDWKAGQLKSPLLLFNVLLLFSVYPARARAPLSSKPTIVTWIQSTETGRSLKL